MSDCELREITDSKKVALMQPTFMPWLGYFALIHDADEFIFLDDFQFVRRSFHQRNHLFLNKDKAGCITVPVEHSGQQKVALNVVKTCRDKKWKRQFLGALKYNYKGGSHLAYYYDFVELWIEKDFLTLADFNLYFIRFVMGELNIKTPVGLSSQHQVFGKRSVKITTILNQTKANTYLSARGSFDYMVEDNAFEQMDTECLFQNFSPVVYPQSQTAQFMPYLSVLDSLLQQGAVGTMETIKQSSGKYLSVQHMTEMNVRF